jgi:hypothetical protein
VLVARFRISPAQFAAAAMYSAAFPLSGLIGDGVQILCLFATMPFLPLGYLIGHVFVAVTGSPGAYSFGLFLAVLLQVWLLLAAFTRTPPQTQEPDQ